LFIIVQLQLFDGGPLLADELFIGGDDRLDDLMIAGELGFC